jgi:hypothetical protein
LLWVEVALFLGQHRECPQCPGLELHSHEFYQKGDHPGTFCQNRGVC